MRTLFLLAAAATLGAQPYQPTWESLDKRPTPAWFTDASSDLHPLGRLLGAWFTPRASRKAGLRRVVLERDDRRQGRSEANAIQTGTWAFHQKTYGAGYSYQDFAPQFRAELFDPDHWADVLARSGAKYVALTSKHHEGFALCQQKRLRRPGDGRGTRWRSGRGATCSAI